MKQLIDLRWVGFADSLWTANSGGNTAFDTVKLGLTGAATAITGPTAQILSGIATFAGGVQSTVNQDYLYNKTLQLIVLQMQKDRATWADTINKQLMANSYSNMYEAANDLYQYARAGSWTHALASMQADSGAQTAACSAQVQSTKQANAALLSGKTGTARQSPLPRNPARPFPTRPRKNPVADSRARRVERPAPNTLISRSLTQRAGKSGQHGFRFPLDQVEVDLTADARSVGACIIPFLSGARSSTMPYLCAPSGSSTSHIVVLRSAMHRCRLARLFSELPE